MCWLSFHMHMWAKWRRWWWHCYSSAPNPIFIYDKYAFSVSSLLLSAHTFKWPRFCIKVCLLSALSFFCIAVVNDSHSQAHCDQHREIWIWKMYENQGGTQHSYHNKLGNSFWFWNATMRPNILRLCIVQDVCQIQQFIVFIPRTKHLLFIFFLFIRLPFRSLTLSVSRCTAVVNIIVLEHFIRLIFPFPPKNVLYVDFYTIFLHRTKS